ncbi:hypothetical protein IR120_12795, partial [Muribacter muris]|uniref:hypothetical protein n=1 Tax=Muribacter muris TaxID=67855 RepID=UPI0018836499
GHLDNRETRVDTDSSEPKGIIALGQLTLNTVGLNNQQGYLISKSERDKFCEKSEIIYFSTCFTYCNSLTFLSPAHNIAYPLYLL